MANMSKRVTSYTVFMRYVRVNEDGSPNVNGILSLECFREWLSTRKRAPKLPGEAFRRAITSHTAGSSKARPFPREIEAALLTILREKQPWPCFRDGDQVIGINGFQGKGHWEKKIEEEEDDKPEPSPGLSGIAPSINTDRILNQVDPIWPEYAGHGPENDTYFFLKDGDDDDFFEIAETNTYGAKRLN